MRSKKSKSPAQIARRKKACSLVLEYEDDGLSITQIAKRCNVDISTIRRWFEGSIPNQRTLYRLKAIRRSIEAMEKYQERQREVKEWHQKGGMELVEEYRKLMEDAQRKKVVDEDRFFELMRHESDGFFLGIVKRY